MNSDYYIEKLRDRVLQDTGSRLFLTLAEELRKRGEQEEAVIVLKNGIEQNRSFTAARLTLGRWLLKDNKLDEACREFSAVLELSPGDRFAVRYLKEIESQMAATKGGAAGRTIERLNRFQAAINKRFAPDARNEFSAGDR